MAEMRFHLTKTIRVCYLGHTDTYDIQGADQASKEWLSDWDLYCNTCKALTVSTAQFAEAALFGMVEDGIGFVTQVPIDIQITEEREHQ